MENITEKVQQINLPTKDETIQLYCTCCSFNGRLSYMSFVCPRCGCALCTWEELTEVWR